MLVHALLLLLVVVVVGVVLASRDATINARRDVASMRVLPLPPRHSAHLPAVTGPCYWSLYSPTHAIVIIVLPMRPSSVR